jgi:hypothetical protein
MLDLRRFALRHSGGTEAGFGRILNRTMAPSDPCLGATAVMKSRVARCAWPGERTQATMKSPEHLK